MGKNINGHCLKCGIFREILNRDHIVPKWKGGTDDPSNWQMLCANCHQDKTMAEHKSSEYRIYQKDLNIKRLAANPQERERLASLSRERFKDPEFKAKVLESTWGTEVRKRRAAKIEKGLACKTTEQEQAEAAQKLALKLARDARRRAKTSTRTPEEKEQRRLASNARYAALTPQQKAQRRIKIAENELLRLQAQLSVEKSGAVH